MFINREAYETIDVRFVLDRVKTYTPYGNQAKREMRPFLPGEEKSLREELRWVSKIMECIQMQSEVFQELENQFKKVKDLTGTLKRLDDGDVLTIPELFEIKNLVLVFLNVECALRKLEWDIPKKFYVQRMPEVELLLDPEGKSVSTFYLYDAYSQDLAETRKRLKTVSETIKRMKKEKQLTLGNELGIKIKSSGEVSVSKDNASFLNVLKSHQELAYCSETYMNMTFKIIDDHDMAKSLLVKEELLRKEEMLCGVVCENLSESLRENMILLWANIKALSDLDVLISKGRFAISFDCVCPEVVTEQELEICDGRHLSVESKVGQENRRYMPVSIKLRSGVTCVTGANMGGKTVTLKMVGLLVWMAQMGLFVPAKSMRLALREFIYTSIGDAQSVDLGLSTFGSEIVKVKEAVALSEGNGLILIDELARGTNPKEGVAISHAILETLKSKETMTVVTTHFDGLAIDSKISHLQVIGLDEVDFEMLRKEFRALELTEDLKTGLGILHRYMDYRLKRIHTLKEVPKDAIKIARLMGLNDSILQMAESKIENKETEGWECDAE